jgi:hypothetical protein
MINNPNTPTYWDHKWRQHHIVYANDPRRDALYRAILDTIAPSSRVLDVGGGCSRFARLAQAQGHRPMVLDLSPWAVRHCAHHGIEARVCDVNEWKGVIFGEFDVGVATEVMEHLERPYKLLELLGAHVPVAYLSVPAESGGPDAHEHLMNYTPQSLRWFLSAYWRCVDVERVGGYLFAVVAGYSPADLRGEG